MVLGSAPPLLEEWDPGVGARSLDKLFSNLPTVLSLFPLLLSLTGWWGPESSNGCPSHLLHPAVVRGAQGLGEVGKPVSEYFAASSSSVETEAGVPQVQKS